MRYSLIHLSRDPEDNYGGIGTNDIEFSHMFLSNEEELFDVDNLKIALVGTVLARIYIPEEHPFFNLYALSKEFDYAPQYKMIKDQISKTLDKIIKSLIK